LTIRLRLFHQECGEPFATGASSFDQTQDKRLKQQVDLQSERPSPGLPEPSDGASAANEVDDQNHHRYYQQQMNQATGDVEAEPQEPQNQKYNENRPKHINLLFILLLHPSGPTELLRAAFRTPNTVAWTVE
jgi:hypothetical protein